MMTNGLFLAQDVICLLVLVLLKWFLNQDFLLKYIMVMKSMALKIMPQKTYLDLFSVNCANVINGKIGFCACKSCSNFEGNCDFDDQCLDGLRCGTNNCLDLFGFDTNTDCCYSAIVGDEDFCSIDEPCEINEGDCDSNDECKNHLFCGSKNCPSSLGLLSSADCCEPKGDRIYPIIFQPLSK